VPAAQRCTSPIAKVHLYRLYGARTPQRSLSRYPPISDTQRSSAVEQKNPREPISPEPDTQDLGPGTRHPGSGPDATPPIGKPALPHRTRHPESNQPEPGTQNPDQASKRPPLVPPKPEDQNQTRHLGTGLDATAEQPEPDTQDPLGPSPPIRHSQRSSAVEQKNPRGPRNPDSSPPPDRRLCFWPVFGHCGAPFLKTGFSTPRTDRSFVEFPVSGASCHGVAVPPYWQQGEWQDGGVSHVGLPAADQRSEPSFGQQRCCGSTVEGGLVKINAVRLPRGGLADNWLAMAESASAIGRHHVATGGKSD